MLAVRSKGLAEALKELEAGALAESLTIQLQETRKQIDRLN